MLLFFLIISTFILALFTVLSITPFSHWSIRVTDFPRLQIACLMFINLIVLTGILLNNATQTLTYYGLVTITLVGLGYQLWWILPYTRFFPKEVRRAKGAGTNLSILSANIYGPNQNYSRVIKLIEKFTPDIIVTMETNERWQNALSPIKQVYKHSIQHPLDNLYGIHLYSKLPLSASSIRILVEKDVPSIITDITLPNEKKVKLYVIHPAPPSPTENSTSQERDKELLIVSAEINKLYSPVIITGDFNDVSWSKSIRQFKKTSNLLDPRIGRGIFNTFHAKYFLLRWPLDHLFHSKHFQLVKIKRVRIKGSDHFGIFVELKI